LITGNQNSDILVLGNLLKCTEELEILITYSDLPNIQSADFIFQREIPDGLDTTQAFAAMEFVLSPNKYTGPQKKVLCYGKQGLICQLSITRYLVQVKT
jgi:hypothetical protein